MVGHVPHAIPLEVVGTMMEMADVAWNALEHRRERKAEATEQEDAASLRTENLLLREILADNLSFLQALSKTTALSDDCPPDLHKRLEAAVDGSCFQTKLKALQQKLDNIPHGYIPLGKTEGEDIDDKDIVVYADNGKPAWWVWVPQDKDVECMEVASGIDNENYVVISEDNVVDGIANFIAGCIIENPKSKVLSPEELRRTVMRALCGIKDRSKLKKVWEVGKVIYTLSTWGLVFAGLYRHQAAVKVAARGIHSTSKIILKAL